MANMAEINEHSIETNLLKIIPSTIEPPTSTGRTYYTKGHFTYYHYGCDGFNDVVSTTYIFELGSIMRFDDTRPSHEMSLGMSCPAFTIEFS